MGFGLLQRYASARKARWAAGALTAWVAWSVAAPWLFGAEHYRQMLESRLTEATGLDASIGRMTFAFLPVPMFRAADLRLIGDDLTVTVDRIDLAVEVRALPTRRLEVLDLRARGVDVHAPEDAPALEMSVRTILDNVRTFAAKPRPIRGQFHRVEARDIRIMIGESDRLVATGRIAAEELQSPQPHFAAEIRAPEFGENARLTAQGPFPANDGWDTLNCTGHVSGLDASKIFLHTTVKGHISATLALAYSESGLRIEADGQLNAQPAVLAGPLRGTIWWRDGMVVVNDFRLSAPELTVALEATRYTDGRWALQIPKAEAGASALTALLGEDAPANPQTTATAENWLLARDTAGWRTVAGTGLLRAWQPTPESAPDVTLAADYALSERGIRIGGKDDHGLQWVATIAPADAHWHTLHIAGAGRAPVTHPWIHERMPEDVVTKAGDVNITDFRGTYTRGKSQPLQWSAAGLIDGVAIEVRSGKVPLKLNAIGGSFRADLQETKVDLRGSGADLGPWSAAGTWRAQSRTWSGGVTLDVPSVAAQWEAVQKQQDRLAPVLAAFGKSRLEVEALFPKESDAPIEIRATRTGMPAATLDARWRRSDQGASLDKLDLSATLPAQTLAGFAPKAMSLEGVANIVLARTSDGFNIDGNLSDARIAMGWWLDKQAGAPFTVNLSTHGGGELGQLLLQANGERLAFRREDNRLISQDAVVNLAALAPFTPFADSLRGTARGEIVLQPFEGKLAFADAAAMKADGASIDALSGVVQWGGEKLALTHLAVAAANSELLINAALESGRWTGTVSGRRLDASAGAKWYEQITSLAKQAPPDGNRNAAHTGDDAAETRPRQPVLGEVNINLDKVRYRRGEFEFFEAKLTGDAEELRLDEVQFRPNTGKITGSAAIVYTDDGRVVRAKLQGETIDARILDEVLFEQPRGIFGVVNAAVDLETPWGDTKTMLNGLDGTVHWRAKDGSWGRMGFATKLLTALNATDIFRLKKPDFTDRGLTYNTCSGMLVFTEGVMQLRDVEMRAPAYTLTAAGTVDYPLDAADVAIRVAPLAGVNRRFADVPVLREIAKQADRLTDVRLRMTGSPFDPTIGLASGF